MSSEHQPSSCARVTKNDRDGGLLVLPEGNLGMRFHPFAVGLIRSQVPVRSAHEAVLTRRGREALDAGHRLGLRVPGPKGRHDSGVDFACGRFSATGRGLSTGDWQAHRLRPPAGGQEA